MISFLFLTRNRLGVTARCFKSLADTLRREDVEWRIVDNGSTDGTAEWLLRVAAAYPGQVHVTLRADNTGVAGGRQLLLNEARGDTLVILDADVEARRAGWLERLLAPLADPSIGICGPGGNWVTAGWQWYEPVTVDYAGPCDTISGYCQAFRRDVLDRGAVMDMAFNPYWHEDSDWCMQIAAMGLKVWCTGDVGLYHIYAGTGDTGGGHIKQRYLASKWRGKGLVRHEREPLAEEARTPTLKAQPTEVHDAPHNNGGVPCLT